MHWWWHDFYIKSWLAACHQVVVALLEPLQEGGKLTAAAARAVEELVVTGRALLQAKLRGLPPLPQSIPALESVGEVLKQERGTLTVEEQVRLLLQSLQHDSPNVQATAVQVQPLASLPFPGRPATVRASSHTSALQRASGMPWLVKTVMIEVQQGKFMATLVL
jgi:hypothetical protein